MKDHDFLHITVLARPEAFAAGKAEPHQLATVLREIARRMSEGEAHGVVHGIDGKPVGMFDLGDPVPVSEYKETTVAS